MPPGLASNPTRTSGYICAQPLFVLFDLIEAFFRGAED